jgi:putative hydrolase of HD superfamily
MKMNIREGLAIIEQTGELGMRFARTFRAPRYPDGRPESDSEHTTSLGLLAVELCARYYPQFDIGRVALVALIHDLAEIEAGDTPTLNITDNQLREKFEREKAARTALRSRYPVVQALFDLEEVYDCDTTLDRIDGESALVFVADKIQPGTVHKAADMETLRSLGITSSTLLLESVERTRTRIERLRPIVPFMCDLWSAQIMLRGDDLDRQMADGGNGGGFGTEGVVTQTDM